MIFKINEQSDSDLTTIYNPAEDPEFIKEDKVYADPNGRNGGFSIHIDRGLSAYNMAKDPYIKVCDDPDWDKAERAVRVHVNGMILDYSHKSNSHKDPFILNAKDKSMLNKIMEKKSTNKKYKDLTVEQAIRKEFEDKFRGVDTSYLRLDFTKCVNKGETPIYTKETEAKRLEEEKKKEEEKSKQQQDDKKSS